MASVLPELHYDFLMEVFKFLSRKNLNSVQWTCRYFLGIVQDNLHNWPLYEFHALTFYEPYHAGLFAKTLNFSSYEFSPDLLIQAKLSTISLNDHQMPLFLGPDTPILFVFELDYQRQQKFYLTNEVYVTQETLPKIVFWLQQISLVHFDVIRHLGTFNPAFLQLLQQHGLGSVLCLQCDLLMSHDSAAFEPHSVHFAFNHLRVNRYEKRNGMIYSKELLDFLYNGADCCNAFSTYYILFCGPDFTDNLIQYVEHTTSADKLIPSIMFSPGRRQRWDFPMPHHSLSSPNVALIHRDVETAQFELTNAHDANIKFRILFELYFEPDLREEECISSFQLSKL